MEKDRFFKSFAGIAAIISLSVDLVTVGLLLKNLYYGVVPFNIESAVPWLFIIILIFIFSILLFTISHANSNDLDEIITIFSWFYVILCSTPVRSDFKTIHNKS